MSNRVPAFRARLLGQAAAAAIIAGLGAACSAETLGFREPFITGSTANQREILGTEQPMPAPVPGGETITRSDLAPPTDVVAAAGPGPAPMPLSGASGWSASGGSVIRVGPGESLDTLALRYGVPSNEIARANGIHNPGEIHKGKMIVIPVRVAMAPAPAPMPVAVAPMPAPAVVAVAPRPVRPAPTPVASGSIHVVESGQTLYSIARQNGTSVDAIVALNGLESGESIRAGQRLQMPNGSMPVAAPVTVAYRPAKAEPMPLGAAPKPLGSLVVKAPKPGVPAAPAPVAAPPVVAVVPKAPVAAAPASPLAPTIAPAPTPVPAVTALDPVADAPSATGTSFRWPVRGRIISSFGAKSNGERNDGINLAVPEGTSVKAAEAGTVIYSGNELPGYGNLILVRHADGWVSAYAHNSEIKVKRGDQVLRGQTIAHAGMTGSVSAPQVHFELRRGAKPVNPLDYLAGA